MFRFFFSLLKKHYFWWNKDNLLEWDLGVIPCRHWDEIAQLFECGPVNPEVAELKYCFSKPVLAQLFKLFCNLPS